MTTAHGPNDQPDDPKRRLNKKLRKISKKLHRIEMALAGAADDLAYLTEARTGLAEPGLYVPVPPPAGPGGDPSDEADKALRAQAQRGVQAVKVKRDDTGATLRIPGHPSVHVPQALADVLEILIEDDGIGSNGKVAWKTGEDLAWRLTKRGKGAVSRRAITERIFRLRRVMRAGGLNSYFVQSDRKRGYRFALRRKGPGGAAIVTGETGGGEDGEAAAAQIA